MRDIAGMDIERRDKALAGLRFLIARGKSPFGITHGVAYR